MNLHVPTNTLSWNITYTGLTGPATLAHFHQAPPGVNGAIQINLTVGSPMVGSQVITAAQTSQILAGNWYINVHTMMHMPGEIRGQLVPAPTLGTQICSPAVANSTGFPGVMAVTGSDIVADDCLTLAATQLPTTSNIGYFLMGTGTNTFTPPGSAGPICIAPGLLRYLPPVENTTELPGGFSRVVGTAGPISGNITAGSTWSFQAWHRDGMNPSNLTDAVTVTFN